MGWWDQALNGGHAPAQARPVSTPAPSGQWVPNAQYQPPARTQPWEQPPVDPVQRQSIEISEDVRNLMDEGQGTWSYGGAPTVQAFREDGTNLGSGVASPMFLREIPDDVDPTMLSMAERHEWMWQRAARSPLQGKSRAMRAEPERCPNCGDARFFRRKANSRDGKVPAPMCMACSYTGESYEITTLN